MFTRSGAGRAVAMAAFVVAIGAVLLVLFAGPGTRLGLWQFRMGLGLLRGAACAAFFSAAAALAALLIGGSRRMSWVALLVAIGTAAGLFGLLSVARRFPLIHDISTDTEDPPSFVAVLARRGRTSNSAAYGGPAVAAAQHRAFPEIRSLDVVQAPDRTFERCLETVHRLGWEVVEASPTEGRVEATDTTPWFGFKDDVVLRIRPQGSGSRVDVRSVSRVGRGDIGTNARRVRRFLTLLAG